MPKLFFFLFFPFFYFIIAFSLFSLVRSFCSLGFLLRLNHFLKLKPQFLFFISSSVPLFPLFSLVFMLYPSPAPPMAPESKRKLMGILEPPPETSVFSSQARINKWLPWQRPFVILPVFPLVWLALNPRFLSYFISFYAFICLFIIYTFVTFISSPPFYGLVSTYLTFLKFSVCLARFAKYWRNVGGSCCLALFIRGRSDLICGLEFASRGCCFDFVMCNLFLFLALYGFLYYVKLYEWCVVIWPCDLCIWIWPL